MQQQIKEKVLLSGESLTMTFDDGRVKPYDVNCWDIKGNNRWNVSFKTRDEAEIEFRRWEGYQPKGR